eukprot:UN18240
MSILYLVATLTIIERSYPSENGR